MPRSIRAVLIFAPIFLMQPGCGSSTAPQQGAIQLSIAARCAISATQIWDLYVDLQPIGSAQIAPGASHTFNPVEPGTHAVRVLRSNGLGTFRYDWPALVVGGGTATPILIDCPPLT